MQKNEMLLSLGIYGKVTEWAQTYFQGSHLCKWIVGLFRITENTSPVDY